MSIVCLLKALTRLLCRKWGFFDVAVVAWPYGECLIAKIAKASGMSSPSADGAVKNWLQHTKSKEKDMKGKKEKINATYNHHQPISEPTDYH